MDLTAARRVAPVRFLLACLGVLLSLWLGYAAAQESSAAAIVPFFETSSCPFDLPDGAEGNQVICGFVVVPEDHGEPTGRTTRLATVIIKATQDDAAADPIILLAGGPGERIVQRSVPLAQILAPLRARRDLVIFDQRGVGLSEPALECPEVVQIGVELLNETNLDEVARVSYEAIAECSTSLVGEGHNLSLFSTAQNAADVEAVRIALGYEQVNLYGGSYGSQLAQAVMRDHPTAIRSVVMESVYPLEASLLVQSATTVPRTILSLIEACAADAECDAAYPNLREALYEVIDRLNAEPASLALTHPTTGEQFEGVLTGDTLLASLRTILYVTAALPAVPAAIYGMYDGDFGMIERLASLRLAFLDAVSLGMEYSVLCAEDLIGHSFTDLLTARAEIPPQLAGTQEPAALERYGIFAICEAWPVGEAQASVKDPLTSDIPTLLLSGEFDHVTPPEFGRTVASRLSRSFFFMLPAGGHSGENLTPCALSITAAFLDRPTAEPDASCIASLPRLAFDLPIDTGEPVELEPFTDEARGFAGLIPAGWEELDTTNLVRARSALDPSYFVLEAARGTAHSLFANLSAQLSLERDIEPVNVATVGAFTWTFYEFDRGGNRGDLALAEDGEKAYFVYMVSAPEERDALFETLFVPAVAALRALE